jgi:cytochrome c-type biogenesis protein CcmE
MSRKVIQIIASVALVGGSLTYLIENTMSEEMEYFHPADIVIVEGEKLVGQRFRMGGHVVKDSIFQKPGTQEYQFSVSPIPQMMKHPEARDKTIIVSYIGFPPDTFKDDAEVIATGVLQADGTFAATDLLAKCPSKYEAKEKNEGVY